MVAAVPPHHPRPARPGEAYDESDARRTSGRPVGNATAAWISLFEQLPWGTSTI